MPLKTKGFRLDEALIQELATKAESMNMSESEIVRKALVCFLGIKFDNDCASYDELQTVKQKLDKVIQFLNIDI